MVDVTIVGGGAPDPAVTEAIVEAVRRTRPEPESIPEPEASRWALAGRQEAVGRSRIGSPAAFMRR